MVAIQPAAGDTLGFLGMLLGMATAGVLILRRSSRLEAKEKTAWRFFAVSLFLAASGVAVVGVLTLVIGDLPAFGATDIFFAASYAMLVFTIIRLARSDGDGASWVTTLLDALVGGIALSALVWTAFYHELVETFTGAPEWETAIAVTYPILDIAAIIGLMILVIRRSHYHLDLRLVFLAVGLSFQVLSDFVYLNGGVGRTFAEAEPAWPLLLLATAGWLTAASLVDRTPHKREFPEQSPRLFVLVWPYLLATALLATHVVMYRNQVSSGDEVVLLDALILIGVVIFVRQVFEIHRNRRRVEAQRSELVASVSHELRTPLTAMVGYLSLLDDNGDEFPEDAKRLMLSEATDQAKHIARLVSDLVMLAHGSYRQLPIQIEEANIGLVVSAALRAVDAGGTRIDIEMNRDVSAEVDADRLQQALTNLIVNAVRYGGDHLSVIARAVDGDLLLEVHDNGDGIPTRFERNVWNRFERGSHRFDASTPGLGIGLAIVQAIAEAHGGIAEYRRSELLGGACFSLLLPGCVISTSPKHSSAQLLAEPCL